MSGKSEIEEVNGDAEDRYYTLKEISENPNRFKNNQAASRLLNSKSNIYNNYAMMIGDALISKGLPHNKEDVKFVDAETYKFKFIKDYKHNSNNAKNNTNGN